jgi:electron transfer flavoprotein alpha subunit
VEGEPPKITAGCRLCRLCIDVCPQGAILLGESPTKADPGQWRGVLVVAEQLAGRINPVTYELIGKGVELAGALEQEIACLLMGHQVMDAARELLHYGLDKVYLCDHPELEYFRSEPYTEMLVETVERFRPGILLIGATPTGRSLAPRAAVRLRTGLTADCTMLEVRPDGQLVQIRPAFGGDIMAQIITPNHRPQMATVRYRVMERAQRVEPRGEIISIPLKGRVWNCPTKVLEIIPKPDDGSLVDAEVIVAVGRGITRQRDMEMVQELARLLKAQIGGTRPMAEAGWVKLNRQIGLSGRTVRPQLLITCGVSGSVQFRAGITNAKTIMAINNDPRAPIFDVAHYGLLGDLYEILPCLIGMIKEGRRG